MTLPILERRDELVRTLRTGSRIVIRAPTGSGKSTQVPQLLADTGAAGTGQIVVLQPRRLAARMLARYVAAQRGGPLGGEVGYQVRFESRCGPATRIKYETDGVLLREALRNPRLDSVAAIVFDEFHERHLYGDILLGLARRIQAEERPDLKLVVMSATLDTAPLEQYLAPCSVLDSGGRQFPVRTTYLRMPAGARERPPWDAAAEAFEQTSAAREGDVLIFMPGAYEIRRTIERLTHSGAARPLRVLPLHGDLAVADQDAAMALYPEGKVVVSTNVAETSLTIPGIATVIDSGLARKARFDPYRGINTLRVEPISQASAEQRAGRAGRTSPGQCIRLWSEKDHRARIPHELPEVQCVDLSETVLALNALGFADPAAFPWLDPPLSRELERARLFLEELGATGPPPQRPLTDLGRQILAFPAHPRHARMLLEAGRTGCLPSAALLAALTQERDILVAPVPAPVARERARVLGEEHASDLLVAAAAWRHAAAVGFRTAACEALGIHAATARRVGQIRDQFADICRSLGLNLQETAPDANRAVRRCILAGFPDQVACRSSPGARRCRVVNGRSGSLDSSAAAGESLLFVATEIREIGSSGGDTEVRLTQATAIERDWLEELFPDSIGEARSSEYDSALRRVVAWKETRYRDLVLARSPAVPEPGDAARALAERVLEGALPLRTWDHRVEQWILRLNLLAAACPELGLPAFDGEARRAAIERLCLGASGHKDIRDRPVWPVLRAWLSPPQHALVEKHAPERLALPNGRSPRIVYTASGPSVEIRIQELYGVTTPASVAMGRRRVVFHILAPNHRAVQVTDDPGSFWQNHYPQVKKEFQRRYPRHEWR